VEFPRAPLQPSFVRSYYEVKASKNTAHKKTHDFKMKCVCFFSSYRFGTLKSFI
jgi:hypothetical protein